jgi:HEAT repeat protein
MVEATPSEGSTESTGRDDVAARERAATAAAMGTQVLQPADIARLRNLVERDPDARVRAAALGALVRAVPGPVAGAAWRDAAADSDRAVRRRAAETAPALGPDVDLDGLLSLLEDHDAWVAEAAAFALGEREDGDEQVVRTVARVATDHRDALVRESAIAALGALGNPAGLPAVLHGCEDKPAIRRRAVLALAAFEGAEVEAALQRALEDPDWQVRQNAEDLLRA